MPPRKLSRRELLEPHPGDKRYVRRDEKGRIVESVNLRRSLSEDDRREAKHVAKGVRVTEATNVAVEPDD